MRVGIDCQGRVRGNGNEVETMDIRKTKIDSLRPALFEGKRRVDEYYTTKTIFD